MKTSSRTLLGTILSMSLLTVMAGAAIAPAMGIIRQYFVAEPVVKVQLIVSIPALFIILTNLCFLPLSRVFRTRTIAIAGLVLYVAAGAGCFFASRIGVILALRALLGVSVGLIMPLSTGLLAYYYPPEQQARLMGLSAAMNQMGGVVATLLAGILAAIEWHGAFLVYLFGLIALVLVVRYLPNEQLRADTKRGKPFAPRQLLKYHPSVVGMWLLTVVFFVYPTHFALIASQTTVYSTTRITLIMVGLDLVAFFVGIFFGQLMKAMRLQIKYIAPLAMIAGYALLSSVASLSGIVAGSALIGIAYGVGVPYLLTIGSIKSGKNAATTVMPLLSASLYLGQFLTPFVVAWMARMGFEAGDLFAPYKVAVVLSAVLLAQVYLTRRYQSLPPAE